MKSMEYKNFKFKTVEKVWIRVIDLGWLQTEEHPLFEQYEHGDELMVKVQGKWMKINGIVRNKGARNESDC